MNLKNYDNTMKIDLRKKSGRRMEIIDHIKKRGGFSVFWITENLLRAKVAERMRDRKHIVCGEGRFPWIPVKLKQQPKENV